MPNPADQAATLSRIWAAWSNVPELRLGQLLWNAAHENIQPEDLFYIEDAALLKLVETFVSRASAPVTRRPRRTHTCRQCSDEYTPGCFTDDGFCSDTCMQRYDKELGGDDADD